MKKLVYGGDIRSRSLRRESKRIYWPCIQASLSPRSVSCLEGQNRSEGYTPALGNGMWEGFS